MAAPLRTLRLLAPVLLPVYVAADLWGFDGPLKRWVETGVRATAGPWVAKVGLEWISTSQLDAATRELLGFRGKSPDSVPPAELEAVRKEALENRIVAVLVGREAAKARKTPDEWIEAALAAESVVSGDEARRWFAAHAKELRNPERIRVRQVFLPTLDKDPEAVRKPLDQALVDLAAGKKDFAALVKELSEDPASKPLGGDLGWMSRDRLPADFAVPVFDLAVGKPALIRTKLGWHLVEVTERKPAEERDFESARDGVTAGLEAVKRHDAWKLLRDRLLTDHAAEITLRTP